MTHVPIARGSHSVRFFEDEQQVYGTIADYFSQDARLDDFCILIGRPGTYSGVLQLLASRGNSHQTVRSERIRFVDAHELLALVVSEDEIDRERGERFFVKLLSDLPPAGANARVRLYGEPVDLLCERGQHALALQMEDFAGLLLALEPRLSILCGYHLAHFDGDEGAAAVRAVCGKHGHSSHEAAAAQSAGGGGQEGPADPDASTCTIYVVDDDASMRRSLMRLLTVSNWRVRVFDSAEAFLEQADTISNGCLVVDIQLGGMSGLDLLAQLRERRSRLPVIAMSGFHDERFESEARRLGASAYLQKPFEPQLLLDAIARTIR